MKAKTVCWVSLGGINIRRLTIFMDGFHAALPMYKNRRDFGSVLGWIEGA